MFNVFNRSRNRDHVVRQALAQAGLATAADPVRVAVVRTSGQYSGRRVDFFRAFDPAHRDVLLATGHVEQDGAVVINDRLEAAENQSTRAPANRAEHTDDERLVFWDTSRITEADPSAPADVERRASEREA